MPTLEAADYFERNLDRIASITAARGIAVLFSTPPSALRLPGTSHETSGRTYWLTDAAMTQQYRDELDRRMRAVAAELSARGAPVSYVDHAIDASMFLDDCHLTDGGNRRVAADFVAGLAPYVSATTRVNSLSTPAGRRSLHVSRHRTVESRPYAARD